MITGHTSNGYIYTIDERKFRDFRFSRMIAEYNKKAEIEPDGEAAVSLVADMIEFVFGKKETDRIIEFVAGQNDGIADIEVMMAMLKEVMESMGGEVKN